jgi:hypothetical protein
VSENDNDFPMVWTVTSETNPSELTNRELAIGCVFAVMFGGALIAGVVLGLVLGRLL